MMHAHVQRLAWNAQSISVYIATVNVEKKLCSAAEIKPPAWHAEILSDRKEKIESGKANFISLEELRSIK